MGNKVPETLGVLGGMGPLATVDFLNKLTQATPATLDQDHIPMVVHFCPQIPDRSEALAANGPSPLPLLIAAARQIEQSGAQVLVIPCNTAHAWHDELSAGLGIPIIHIVDAAVAQIPSALRNEPVGLLATRGTLASGIYTLRQPELDWVEPLEQEMTDWVMPAIRAVKSGDLDTARKLLENAIESLRHRGARSIVLGCTELPLARTGYYHDVLLIDATEALAHSAIRRVMGRSPAMTCSDKRSTLLNRDVQLAQAKGK